MYRLNYLFLFFAMTLSCFAQTGLPGTSRLTIGSKESNSLFGLNIIEYGREKSISNKNIEGSVYLFKSWNNLAKIWLNDKIFNIDLINYNLQNERFEIKLNNDSILIVNPMATKVEKVIVNNSVFKSYYNKELFRDTFFEVIWFSDEYSLLSNYKLKITPGDINPLTKTYINPKKYIHNRSFYIKKSNDEQMTPIKLKKSEILKLIDDLYVNEVKRFVKKRRLKYNKVSDVKDVLAYYNSIKNSQKKG